jgi:gliding-associated putative ABC transporter substrate-binding component GldG
VPQDYPLGIEDLLYKYGFRVEPNLLADRQCSKIPQVVGRQGDRPQFDMFDWFYHPIVTPPENNPHPVVKSLNGVNMLFPSSVDTIRTKFPTKKTILLTSSRFSKLQYSPVRVSFDILRYQPEASWFNKKEVPVAIMAEGVFSSAYANRVSEEMSASLKNLGKPFKDQSVQNKMVVISDGDVGKNLLTAEGGYKPLGFNAFTEKTYANKDFLVNTIEYLFDDKGVIEARGKDVKLRLMDKAKIEETRGLWQFVNIALPLIFLGIFAFLFIWRRRRKYAKE